MLITIFNAYSDICSVKNSGLYTGVKFQLDKKLIESDEKNFYIGKTNKYLFYYKSEEKESVVYPMSRIKMISYKKIDKKIKKNKKNKIGKQEQFNRK